MANTIEEQTVAPLSSNFKDYVDQGGSSTGQGAGEFFTGSSVGQGIVTARKQGEDPNLRNVAAMDRPVTGIDGQSASEFGAGLVTDPSAFVGDRTLSDKTDDLTIGYLDTRAGELDPADPRYGLDPTGLDIDLDVPTSAETATMQDSRTGGEGAYDVATTEDKIEDVVIGDVSGELSEGTLIDQAAQVDLGATARGETEVGSALKDFVSTDISNVIDTSTVAGKLLADELGSGNYVDAKTTVKGQLDILAKDMVDANGNPVIPTWAASGFRSVNRAMAFKGVTGTAAMAAIQGAIMESAIDIAKEDSDFFQTLTISNIDNEQQALINRANIMSKLEIQNLDNRQQALVQNSKSLLELDLTNLDNELQAEILNAEMRSQAIFDAAAEKNIQRKFQAQTEADLMQIYDTLATEVSTFNAKQRSAFAELSLDADLAEQKFNADLANDREQFQIKNQLLIDETNAKWRQDVTKFNKELEFTAAADDVKNSLSISAEALNRLWDETDQIFDYLWRSTENELDRASNLTSTIIGGEYRMREARLAAKASKKSGLFSALGSIAGAYIGATF